MPLKYFAQYRDVNGVVIRTEIHDNDHTLAPVEMTFDGKGCVVRYPEKGVNEPIFSCGVELNIRCSKLWQYTDLFTTSERKNRVLVYRDSDLIFAGYIEPNLYEQEWLHAPYIIRIPATDGLTALDGYEPAIASGVGMFKIIDIIKSCLDQTGLTLPIMICCSLYEENMNVNVDTIFDIMYVEYLSLQKTLNGEFDSNSANSILSDILTAFNCRIYQAHGMWFVERIKDKCKGYRWKRYNVDGSMQWVENNESIMVDTDDVFFVETPASLSIDSGYGKLTVKGTTNKYDTVIYNNYSVGVKYAHAAYAWDMKRWWLSTVVNSEHNTEQSKVVPIAGFEGINRGLKIENATIGSSYVFQKSMISLVSDCQVKLSFNCAFKRNKKDNDTFRAVFSLGFEPLEFYLYNNGDNRFSIEHISRVPDIGLPKGFTYYTFDKIDTINILDEYKEFSVTIDANCTYDFNLYPVLKFRPIQSLTSIQIPIVEQTWSDESKYVLESYYGDVVVILDDKADYENTHTAVVNTNYRRQAPDVELKIGSIPKIKTYRRDECNWNISHGVYRFVNNQYVELGLIGEVGDLAENTIAEQIILDRFSQYYDPSAKLSGDAYTELFLSPEKLYRLSGRDGSYLLSGCEYDSGESMYKITLEEIKDDIITKS